MVKQFKDPQVLLKSNGKENVPYQKQLKNVHKRYGELLFLEHNAYTKKIAEMEKKEV